MSQELPDNARSVDSSGGPSTGPDRSARRVAAALWLTMGSQALVVAATFALPVVAGEAAARYAVPPAWIGYFSALTFGAAIFGSLAAPRALAALGPARLCQATLLFAATGLALLTLESLASALLAAVLFGLAYGPANPASSTILRAVTPAARRGFVFSLKQTSVPIGGALIGAVLPFSLMALGWTTAFWGAAAAIVVAALLLEPTVRHLAGVAGAPGAAVKLAEMLRRPAVQKLAIMSGLFAGAQFTFSAVGVAVQTDAGGINPVAAAGPVSLAFLASIGVRIAAGWLADRIGGLWVLLGFALTGLAGALATAVCLLTLASPLALQASIFVLGAAVFSWNGVYLAAVAAAVPAEEVGGATAATMSVTFLGGLVVPALIASVAAVGGWTIAFFVLAALTLPLPPLLRQMQREARAS